MADRLLQQDGSLLLEEDGFAVLLEQQVGTSNVRGHVHVSARAAVLVLSAARPTP